MQIANFGMFIYTLNMCAYNMDVLTPCKTLFAYAHLYECKNLPLNYIYFYKYIFEPLTAPLPQS